jgi:hypothetical protein
VPQLQVKKTLSLITIAPGNLADIPQFMTLTFDDAVHSLNWDAIVKSHQNHVNPNGCPVSATLFVSTQYTDFWKIQTLYGLGHEIATHTVNHAAQPGLAEVQGARTILNTFAGVPKNQITGFRAPFLNTTKDTFKHVKDAGMAYDSSTTHMYVDQGIWPYTLDYGAANTCSPGSCEQPFAVPGLWEIPMALLLNKDGSINSPMDPQPIGRITTEETIELLKSNFLRHYNGNRSPM